jgi:hypothetical protein
MAARKRRRYSPEEIERGLTALILAGSSREAEEVTGINARTLRDWKQDHSATYHRLMDSLEPTVVKKIAGESEQIVNRIFGLTHATLDQYENTVHELKPSEAAAAARNLATTSALYVDKHSSPLRERPTHVHQGQDMESLLRGMARALGVQHVPNQADVQGTAVELPSPTPLSPASASLNARD